MNKAPAYSPRRLLPLLAICFLALAALTSCRYTFLPLQPDRVPFPNRATVTGTLEPTERGALVKLTVRRMPEPGYVELRWYKEDQLLEEKSLWLDAPGPLEARFARIDDGFYRVVVSIQNSPLLQLEIGTPLVPPAPAEPAPPAPVTGS